jgi:hypothetical protein
MRFENKFVTESVILILNASGQGCLGYDFRRGRLDSSTY